MFPDLTMMRLAPVDLAKPIGQSGVVLAALVHLLGDRLWLRIVPHPRPGNSPYKIINIGKGISTTFACTRYVLCTPWTYLNPGRRQEGNGPNGHARRRPKMKNSRTTTHATFTALFAKPSIWISLLILMALVFPTAGLSEHVKKPNCDDSAPFLWLFASLFLSDQSVID